MPPQDDRTYLERRLRESRELAQAARDPGVARIHRNYAEHYEKRLREYAPSFESTAPAH